jgi:hypothetical protein
VSPVPSDDYRTLPTKTHFPAKAGRAIVMVPGDKNHTPRPDGPHQIVAIEQDCPGVYQLLCNCGETTWTPWGRESADTIASMHLWAVGWPMMKVIWR